MELLAKLIDQGQLEEREFERNGQKEKFASMRFLFRHGNDSFFGEMVQETARRTGQYEKNRDYVVCFNMEGRSFDGRDGKKLYENRVVITKVMPL